MFCWLVGLLRGPASLLLLACCDEGGAGNGSVWFLERRFSVEEGNDRGFETLAELSDPMSALAAESLPTALLAERLPAGPPFC